MTCVVGYFIIVLVIGMYKKAYKIMDSLTPLKGDCGLLCGSICCKGDENTGMRLFPHEESTLDIKNTECGGRLAVCNGKCDREERPLACRIFPLTPYINSDGKLEIITDPRARAICPLANGLDLADYDAVFVKNIKRAFGILAENKEVYTFLDTYSRQLDEYLRFFK